MIDGDNLGVQKRKEQLEAALREGNEPPRAANEPVVLLVPTWSVETWLLPRGPGVTEDKDLKQQVRKPQHEDFREAARRIVESDVDEPLQSVRDASREVSRISG
jgi:hypothetical protein